MSAKDEHARGEAGKKELPELPLPDSALGDPRIDAGTGDADLLEKLDEALHTPEKPGRRVEPPVRRAEPGHEAQKHRFEQERVELRRVRDRSRGRPGGNVPPAGGGKSRGRG